MHLNAIYYSNILVFALVCTLNFSKVTIATLKNLGLARFLRGEKGESKLNIKDQIFTKILYHWTLKPEKVYVLGKSLTIFLLGMRNWKLRLEVKMYFKYVKYLNTVGKDHTHHHHHPQSRSNREQEVPKGTHPSLTGVAPGADEKGAGPGGTQGSAQSCSDIQIWPFLLWPHRHVTPNGYLYYTDKWFL